MLKTIFKKYQILQHTAGRKTNTDTVKSTTVLKRENIAATTAYTAHTF